MVRAAIHAVILYRLMNGHLEDQLDEKLLQVNVDLNKVGGGLIGEHEEQQQQDPRMIGKLFCHSAL